MHKLLYLRLRNDDLLCRRPNKCVALDVYRRDTYGSSKTTRQKTNIFNYRVSSTAGAS